MRVLLIGAHSTSGLSMQRYTKLLERAYGELDVQLIVLRPPSQASARWRWPGLKWVGYFEKFVLFWPVLWLRAARVDVVHLADHSDAIWALGLRGRQVVVSCHDLIAVMAALGELPEHRPAMTGRAYQALVRRGLAASSAVLSISRTTATDVERITGRRSSVLYNPLDEALLPPADPAASPTLLHGRYLLVVSTRSWRKRRVAAVTAWARLRSTRQFQGYGLVVVGDPIGPEEYDVAAQAGAADLIVHLASVSDGALAALYSAAGGLLQLSRYEGFGWPIVEAQAHRVPVLTSDGDVFREAAGGHACVATDVDLVDVSTDTWQRIADELTAVDLEAAYRSTERFAWHGFVDRLGQLVVRRPPERLELTTDTRREAPA